MYLTAAGYLRIAAGFFFCYSFKYNIFPCRGEKDFRIMQRTEGKRKMNIWIPAAGIFVCAGLFCMLLAAVLSGSAAAFDDPVRYAFYSVRSSGLTALAVFITELGSRNVTIPACLILLIIPKTRLRYGVPLSAGALGTVLLNQTLKALVERPRPDVVLHLVEESSFSFPSGHSINSMFCYGILIYLVRRNVRNKKTANILTVLLAIPMILIGPTRVYLGVHYPTDVLAGWSLGLLAVCVTVLILEKIREKRQPVGPDGGAAEFRHDGPDAGTAEPQPISTLPGARSK